MNRSIACDIKIARPTELMADELDAFAECVLRGGQVDEGVRQRLSSAELLGVVRLGTDIVGTAALKRPTQHYRAHCFEHSFSGENPATYLFELGWIYLEADHRGHGYMRRLVSMLLAARPVRTFATTATTNAEMQAILDQFDYVRSGGEYPSNQNPGTTIVLYVRPTA